MANVHKTDQTKRNLQAAREEAFDAGEMMLTPFLTMQRQINRMFEETFQNVIDFPKRMITDPLKIMPKVHVHEDEQAYYLTTNLPGCKQEDINIRMHDNYFTISCQQKNTNKKDTIDALRQYTLVQQSYRTIMIPENGNPNEAEAHLDGETLVIVMPKKEEADKGRKLKIKSS